MIIMTFKTIALPSLSSFNVDAEFLNFFRNGRAKASFLRLLFLAADIIYLPAWISWRPIYDLKWARPLFPFFLTGFLPLSSILSFAKFILPESFLILKTFIFVPLTAKFFPHLAMFINVNMQMIMILFILWKDYHKSFKWLAWWLQKNVRRIKLHKEDLFHVKLCL